MALEERLKRMEHALQAISGFAYVGHVEWREKYPNESSRIRAR
jgi:hypothetical protein